jgi:uncharacterized membrane protein YphA (DoxX/SURF4 family)
MRSRVSSDQDDPAWGDDVISNAVLATWSPRLLSVLRIVAALLFLQHGLAKLLHFPHVAMFDQLQLFSLLGLAGVIELVGSALLLIGLFTRPAAFIMSGEMAVAYFMAHGPPRVLSDPEPGRARPSSAALNRSGYG